MVLSLLSETLGDSDQVDLGSGLSLIVIHMLGHMLRSCRFTSEREGLRIVGDSVLGSDCRAGGLPLTPVLRQVTTEGFAEDDGVFEQVRRLGILGADPDA